MLRFRDALAAGDLERAARLVIFQRCDGWVLDERAKLRAEAYRAFVRLIEACRAQRPQSRARVRPTLRPVAERRSGRSNSDGSHLAWNRAAARARAWFAEVLERELAVAPGEAIEAVYQRLRARTLDREEGQRKVQGEDLVPSPNRLSWAASSS